MARETKIGLIVGMGVIILIGILISDHLSVAQRQQDPHLTGVIEQQNLGEPDALPSPYGSASAPQATVQRTDKLPLPAELQPPATPAPQPQVAEVSKPVIFRTTYPAPAYSTTEQTAPPTAPAGSFQLNRTEHVIRLTSPPNSASHPGDPVVHYVQKGESLYQIAAHYYGDGHYWRSIYQANRQVIPDPGQLRTGVRLVIPNKADKIDASKIQTSSASQGQTEAPASRKYRSYTIQRGDSLSELASRFMGSAKRWHDLYELNRKQIRDPDMLVAGTVIQVPAR